MREGRAGYDPVSLLTIGHARIACTRRVQSAGTSFDADPRPLPTACARSRHRRGLPHRADQLRPLAFGAGTAAGSFGQFLYPPIGNLLIDAYGWHQALLWFAASVLAI